MKYLRRELNQVEKEYLKQFGPDSLDRVVLHNPNTKNKFQKICGNLLSFKVWPLI